MALAQGYTTTAKEHAERALQEAEVQSDRQETSRAYRLLTDIYLELGQCADAKSALEQALTTTRANQDRYGELQTLVLQARLQYQCGNREIALATLESTIQALTELGAQWDLGEAQSLLETW